MFFYMYIHNVTYGNTENYLFKKGEMKKNKGIIEPFCILLPLISELENFSVFEIGCM